MPVIVVHRIEAQPWRTEHGKTRQGGDKIYPFETKTCQQFQTLAEVTVTMTIDAHIRPEVQNRRYLQS
jgi:hypothetical protein